jgi:hypothetical protein
MNFADSNTFGINLLHAVSPDQLKSEDKSDPPKMDNSNPVAGILCPQDSCIDPEPYGQDAPDSLTMQGLCTINEHGSEAGSSTYIKRSSSTQDTGTLIRNGLDWRSQTEQTNQDYRAFRGVKNFHGSEALSYETGSSSRQPTLTPVTSVANLSRSDVSPQQDTNDSDDSTSDITDYTEVSWLEAFDETSLSQSLLALTLDLKEHVETQVMSKVLAVFALGDGQDGTTGGQTPSYGRSSNMCGNGSSSPHQLSGSRKRAFNGDGIDGSDEDNGDDREKRQKLDAPSQPEATVQRRRLACPFYKQYPQGKWPRACHGPGWGTIHRVKYVISEFWL